MDERGGSSMSGAPEIVTLVAALGCGTLAGVWFAFSGFVMAALGRLPAPQGIAAMQSINRLAPTPPLMTAMFGTALLCLGLMIWALLSLDETGARWVLAGGVVYLVGTIGVTMAGNVPLNNALESADPESAAGAELWSEYLRKWTAWNHVRLLGSLAAAALLVLALIAD
jgi:uncharacterized membrane protein